MVALMQIKMICNTCHGRKSNLVEFQILPVESPIGVSTGRKSSRGDLGIALGSEI